MDETLNCILVVDEDNKKAIITGLQAEDFEIDFTSDIDFTDLVSILTEQIDTPRLIELNLEVEPTDEKLKLITDTIKEIFEIYSENLLKASETNDTIPF
jgi:hypothetical protein